MGEAQCLFPPQGFSAQYSQSSADLKQKNWKECVAIAEMEYAPYCKLVWKPLGGFAGWITLTGSLRQVVRVLNTCNCCFHEKDWNVPRDEVW